MRFLIVDDGLGTPGTTASLLMADGHVVRVERGGFDAIGAAVNFKPDVVLIDFQSQVSSAYAVARTIRSANPSSKIIAVVESASIGVPLIFDLVLVKWFDYAALKQWVANHIEPWSSWIDHAIDEVARLRERPIQYLSGAVEFRALNAGYEGPVLIQGAGRQIVLPVDKVDEFHAKLDNNNDPLVRWEPYTMKPGETLQKLASKFATTVSRLRRVNHFHRQDHIHPGEIVLVPLGSEDDMTEPDLLHNRAEFDPFPAIYRAARSHRVRSVRAYTALPPRTILSDTPKRSTHERASSYTKPQPSLAQRR